MLNNYKLMLMAFITLVSVTEAYAKNNDKNRCFPEPLEVLAELPMPKEQASLITVSERIVIQAPINEVYRSFEVQPLSQLLTETDDVSGVDFTYSLKGDQYLIQGDKRVVCLTDGYGAVEVLLYNDRQHRFAYCVWNFSLPEAKGIAYGDGEFLFKSLGTSTEIIWNYQFALKKGEFPGYLGGFGRWLFEKTFAESIWKTYMHQALINFNNVVD